MELKTKLSGSDDSSRSWEKYNTSYISFDRTSIPNDFLLGCQDELENLINKLEQEIVSKDTINAIYDDFTKFLENRNE